MKIKEDTIYIKVCEALKLALDSQCIVILRPVSQIEHFLPGLSFSLQNTPQPQIDT